MPPQTPSALLGNGGGHYLLDLEELGRKGHCILSCKPQEAQGRSGSGSVSIACVPDPLNLYSATA